MAAMFALFAIVFVGLLGVTLVIPLFPFFAYRVNAGPDMITAIMAVYAAGQFIAAPFWGKVSDSIGRKPVFLISTIGGIVSYVMLGFADSIEMLLASRAIGGLMAGNVAVAFASMADLTTNENRAKGMGLIGGAFNLGFIAGPAMGGILAGNDAASADLSMIALVAGALSAVAFVATALFLPETLPPEKRRKKGAGAPAAESHIQGGFKGIWLQPALAMLVILGFVYVAAGSMLDTTFALYANLILDYGPRDIGFLFSYLGVVGGIVQIATIGPLVKRVGDANIVKGGIAIYAVGLSVLIFSEWLPLIILAMTCVSVGNSLFLPGANSLVSRLAPEHERGLVLGVYQAANNLGRVITPLFSGLVFAKVGAHAPFVVGLVLLIPALALIFAIARRAPHVPVPPVRAA
ncbi:MAG: MFS transporter [Rhodospirillaceae bacterium]|nr:MFS transporter [Rhodospirillaceae bacterium]